MQPIVEVRSIARPLAEVYAYLADTPNLADWVPGITRLNPLSGSPTAGDVITFTVNGLSNRMTFSAVELQKRLAYEVHNALVILPVVIELEQVDDATTRMTKSQTVQPVGFGRILGPLLKRALGKQVSDEADLIKQQVEK
jgi:uncharacterized protein YndB with AHSA1/START domain